MLSFVVLSAFSIATASVWITFLPVGLSFYILRVFKKSSEIYWLIYLCRIALFLYIALGVIVIWSESYALLSFSKSLLTNDSFELIDVIHAFFLALKPISLLAYIPILLVTFIDKRITADLKALGIVTFVILGFYLYIAYFLNADLRT